MFTERIFTLIALGMAARADAGAVLELMPGQAGPYSPGQTVSVDVWLHNQEPIDIDLRLVILEFTGLRDRLFAGGEFTSSGGVPVNHVAMLSGGASGTSLQAPGTDAPVFALQSCMLNGGTALYAGGRVNSTGGWKGTVHRLEPGWWTEIGRLGERILSLFCTSNGVQNQLYAGGQIWERILGIYGFTPWNGSQWTPVIGFQGEVRDVVIFDDGTGPTFYAAGRVVTMYPSSFPYVLLNYIAKWTGTSWVPLSNGVGNGYTYTPGISALTVFDDGTGPRLYAAGEFRDVLFPEYTGSIQVNNIAKWDGTAWSSVGGGTTPGTLAPIYDLVVFDDGTGAALYAGGDFNSAGGVPVNNIARWDGTAWHDVGGGVIGGTDTAIRAMAVYDDGSGPALYVGGRFTNAGGVPVSNIAKWNGTNWSAVGAGFDGTVLALALHEATGDPNLLIGDFQFDFSTLSDGGARYGTAYLTSLSVFMLFYSPPPVQGSMLHLSANGSLRLGQLQVEMPEEPGTYRLDAADPYALAGGSILAYGFGETGDPYTEWFAYTGQLSSARIPFEVTCNCQLYADIVPPGGDCIVDLADLLCVLDGIDDPLLCPDGDIAPCGGDGLIELADLLAVLDAYSGVYLCPHPCSP